MLVGDGEYNFTFYENAKYTGREVMNCTDKLMACYNQQKERADKMEAQIEKYKWIHNRIRIGDLDGAMFELAELEKEASE